MKRKNLSTNKKNSKNIINLKMNLLLALITCFGCYASDFKKKLKGLACAPLTEEHLEQYASRFDLPAKQEFTQQLFLIKKSLSKAANKEQKNNDTSSNAN